MTPAELARRLERSFAVLAAGRRGALAHHQTLRATIDWSFQLLTEPEQALLAGWRCSPAAAPWRPPRRSAAERVSIPTRCSSCWPAWWRGRWWWPRNTGRETRYRLLETIRQYGEERLGEAGETERWRARHADYYARPPATGPRPIPRSAGEVFWAVRLSAEQDNLLAAWSWAIDTGNVDTAFSMLAGFAPVEVWTGYPLLLPGEAALELPGGNRAPRLPARSRGQRRVRVGSRRCEAVPRSFAAARPKPTRAVDSPDWRVEETICAARSNIAITTGAFADAARFAEQAARPARTGGDLADTSVLLAIAAGGYVLAGDAPRGVPLAKEALALARRVGAPTLIATALLAVGAAVAPTDANQARVCMRESRELSTALGYQSALDRIWAATIAFLVGDRTATLQVGRRAIHALRWSGDRLRIGIILHLIAGAFAASRPDAAAIIQGAAEAHVIEAPSTAQQSPRP